MLLTITSKINAIKEFIKAGDYDSAVEIAERINPEKVSSVSDLYTIAKAFLKKRRLEDAKEIYIEVHNHVVNHKVLVGLIELCLKTNCPEEAETYIREFRKLEPDNPERLIYRYRVDVLLGKGPEYLVKSLSKLKDEDYTDVWALELAKAYFKMDDYQKCAQECKDILLWFAGSESAAKAHILLSACAEKGVTITMPESKPHHDEDYYDDEPTPDVPVIGAELEEKVEEVEEDTTFFDVAAAIGEAVSETIDEDASKAAETENEMPYSFAEANNNEEGYAPVEDNGEQSSAEEEPEAESEEEYYDLEAVSEIHFAAEALEAANDEGLGADEEKAAQNDTEDDNEEDVPEDATETLTFLFKYYEEENRRKAEEEAQTLAETNVNAVEESADEASLTEEAPAEEMAEEFVGEELAEESSEDELVEDELAEEEIFDKELVEDELTEEEIFDKELAEEELTEEEASEDELAEESAEDESDTEAAGSEGFFEENSEEPADESSDVLPVDESSDEMERTMIALAIKKAKEADDDEDDIVFHDYYPRAAYKNLEGKNRVLPLRTEALQPKKPVAAAPVAPTETVTPVETVEEEEVITPSEEPEAAEFADFDELAAEEQRKDFAESISESIALSLEKDEVKDKELDVEGEEEDGQLSFLSMDEDADMKISFSRRERNEEAEDDMFGISGAIAESVREEIESGNTEADDVSASPTKIHGELTAQVLDAMLREDDEAVEKALYGLLADK